MLVSTVWILTVFIGGTGSTVMCLRGVEVCDSLFHVGNSIFM